MISQTTPKNFPIVFLIINPNLVNSIYTSGLSIHEKRPQSSYYGSAANRLATSRLPKAQRPLLVVVYFSQISDQTGDGLDNGGRNHFQDFGRVSIMSEGNRTCSGNWLFGQHLILWADQRWVGGRMEESQEKVKGRKFDGGARKRGDLKGMKGTD